MEKGRGSLEDMERLKVAITGASGFVGANLIRYLDEKHEVYSLTRSRNSWRVGNSFNTINFDIRNRDRVYEILKQLKPDLLIHCATFGGYHFEMGTREIVETNVIGSLNVINASASIPMVINVGSSSEYGVKLAPMREEDISAPISDYAMSKALQTSLFRSIPNSITLRLFSVFGYYEEKHRLIPYLLYSSIKDQKALLSNKKNVRDFVFVEDVCRAFSLVIENFEKIEKRSVFNIGSGEQKTVENVVNELKVNVEWNSSVREKEPSQMWQADITKIREEVGWEPRNSLREGLRKTRMWMEKNIELYEVDNNDKLTIFRQNSTTA